MRNLRGVIPSLLRQRAATLTVLDQLLAECLPAECRAHCRVAGVEDSTLILVTDSPAWRSRVQFLADDIIRYFCSLDKLAITRIRVRVGRPDPPARPRTRRHGITGPTKDAARALEDLAGEVDDEALAASLRRLATRGR